MCDPVDLLIPSDKNLDKTHTKTHKTIYLNRQTDRTQWSHSIKLQNATQINASSHRSDIGQEIRGGEKRLNEPDRKLHERERKQGELIKKSKKEKLTTENKALNTHISSTKNELASNKTF